MARQNRYLFDRVMETFTGPFIQGRWQRVCEKVVVYLHPADKYSRLTHRPSRGQKGIDERALIASLQPSKPCGRPRSEPCGRTSPAQASAPGCFPSPLRTHTPTGCGHGGTRKSHISGSVQTWSVSPAASAGVQGRHRLAEPLPLVGSGCGRAWRKEACGRQKLE